MKTELSKREVSASIELMNILKEYKAYIIKNNIFYNKLFVHPDSTMYQLDIFNKKRTIGYSNNDLTSKEENKTKTVSKTIDDTISQLREKMLMLKEGLITQEDYDDLGNEKERYGGYRYKVSPYFMVNNNGKYYLIGKYPKYDYHINFKMDYIIDVQIEDEKATHIKEVKSLGENFNITKYINDHIYMFSGNVINAKLEIISKAAPMNVIDWFGK